LSAAPVAFVGVKLTAFEQFGDADARLLRRLGSHVNAAAAVGAGRVEAEAANRSAYLFEAPGVSWEQARPVCIWANFCSDRDDRVARCDHAAVEYIGA
jgi:hypothetical protein